MNQPGVLPSNNNIKYQPQPQEDVSLNPLELDIQSPEDHRNIAEPPQQVQSKFLQTLLRIFPPRIKLLSIASIFGIIHLFINLTLILTIVTYQPLSQGPNVYLPSSPGALQYISANLMADPIMDIKIIDKESPCPPDFEPLVLGKWRGTVAGCLCENSGLLSSTCQIAQDPKCNIDIPKTSPIDMHHWGSSTWCGKRAILGTDYLKNTVCPQGYKECYLGGCFVQDCPITHVEISSTKTENNKLSKAGTDSKERYLIITRKQGEMPLINFHITPNDIPCLNENRLQPSNHTFIYPLLDIPGKSGCGEFGLDSHFSSKLDSQSSSELYSENSFPKAVMDLPNFAMNTEKTSAILSSQIRMKTARHDSCLDFDEESINFSFKYLHMKGLTLSFTKVLLWCTLFPFAAMVFFNMSSHANESEVWCLERILYLPHYIFQTVMLVKFYNINQTLRPSREYFEVYDSLGCFIEGQGSVVLNDHLVILKNLVTCFWLYLGLFILNTFVGFIWISYKRARKLSLQAN